MQPTFFRHEYFGGGLYSQKLPGIIPIEEPFWSRIAAAVDSAGAAALREAVNNGDESLKRTVEQCRRLGALDNSLRVTCEVFRAPYPLVRGALSAPIRVYLHITDRCNLQCEHCMFACGRGDAGPEMGGDQVRQLLGTLHAVRCPEVRITGGEPTVRADTPRIMAEAKEMGFYVMLNTNGAFGESVRRRILAARPDELIFSLDGTPERHDALRGPGAFARLDGNLRAIVSRGESGSPPTLTVNFTFGRHNRHDLDWVVRYAAGLRMHVNLMPLRPFGAAKRNLLSDMLAPAEFLEFTQQVVRLRQCEEVAAAGIRILHKNFDLAAPAADGRGAPPPFDKASCGACSFGLGINPDGRANACGFLAQDERFIGPSLLDTPFEQVWFGPRIHGFRNVVKLRCEGCRYYRRQCTGSCKAMALAAADGDDNALSGDDPYCPFSGRPIEDMPAEAFPG